MFDLDKESRLSEIHFVYLAKKIPRYAWSSIELACESSDQNVVLVANEAALKPAKNFDVRVEVIDDFYDPEPFEKCSRFVTYSHEFRGGFWLKGIERFFVLEQLMKVRSLEDIFHAELDQLLFGSHTLVRNLRDSEEKGIFLPFRNKDVPIASVFYANRADSLSSLISFAQSGATFRSDNELISQWARANPQEIFSLPTFGSSVLAIKEPKTSFPGGSSEKELGGLVDGAQLGHWIGGWDPRNVPIWRRPSTKFIPDNNLEQLFEDDLRRLKFNRKSPSYLELTFDDQASKHRIYNLHLHSKTHTFLLKHDRDLARLISYANSSSSWRIPGTRWTQVLDFILLTATNVGRRLRKAWKEAMS